jgi:hypothetical protein
MRLEDLFQPGDAPGGPLNTWKRLREEIWYRSRSETIAIWRPYKHLPWGRCGEPVAQQQLHSIAVLQYLVKNSRLHACFAFVLLISTPRLHVRESDRTRWLLDESTSTEVCEPARAVQRTSLADSRTPQCSGVHIQM